MRFAICFLTCDRTEYTLRTLETLAQHNDLSRHILLHGDDRSDDQSGPEAARALGFETVVQSSKRRRGVASMTAHLVEAARDAGADAVLNLQNDWESERPIPFVDAAALLGAVNDFYCMRLYGALKSRSGGRCGIHHGGRDPRLVVTWEPIVGMDGYEGADIHWGHPPAITLLDMAIALTAGARTESESRRRSGQVNALTARTIDNVFWHIGRERTKGFVA